MNLARRFQAGFSILVRYTYSKFIDVGESARTLGCWFNSDAFRVPAEYRFGTVGRGAMTGPEISNIDASYIS